MCKCYSGSSKNYICEPGVDPDLKELTFRGKINHMNII